MSDTRLIERWLPIAALGEESIRERRSMTALPPTYYLHVWWARRPLVASRAAVLASLLPADADRERFLHVLGIHGDPVAAKKRIAIANRKGERLGADAYGYSRAFGYMPNPDRHRDWLKTELGNSLDAALQSSIQPLEEEVFHLKCSTAWSCEAIANDLNPVVGTLIDARDGGIGHAKHWDCNIKSDIRSIYRSSVYVQTSPKNVSRHMCSQMNPGTTPDAISTNYLWARTITCPYCNGVVPLSPNWRLAPDETGVRLKPHLASGPGTEGRICSFEIVKSAKKQSNGTVARGCRPPVPIPIAGV